MSKNITPLVVTVIMVKNESETLINTLNSHLSNNESYFFLFDTGSTDNTVEIAKNFFKQDNIIGYVKEEPFIDFSTSRNRALELAKQHFPNAIFFLMPDAEWHLNSFDNLLKFCEEEKNKSTNLYLINTYMNSMEFTTARLFRANNLVEFVGSVHESPITPTNIKCPSDIFYQINNTEHGIEKSKKRWQQDLLLLTEDFHQNKNCPRTCFYLAQTYECLGLLNNAYKIYLHRSKLQGFDEENYITFFRLGNIAELLIDNKTITWEHAMGHYLHAFSLRPHRIEPLVKIANHYWPTNIQVCYLFIKRTFDIPYPKDDILFIEKNMYQYDRYEILSRCAWYMQEFEEGKHATLKALEIHPEMEHLKRNLTLYEQKLAEILNNKENIHA